MQYGSAIGSAIGSAMGSAIGVQWAVSRQERDIGRKSSCAGCVGCMCVDLLIGLSSALHATVAAAAAADTTAAVAVAVVFVAVAGG